MSNFVPNNKTLFIVGAGASHEAGLLVGEGLKEEIARCLNINTDEFGHIKTGDPLVYRSLHMHVNHSENATGKIELYIKAAQHISDSMPLTRSIDQFVNMHKGNEQIELCSKLAIVRSILAAERSSKLKSNVNGRLAPHYDSLGSTWYSKFIGLITDNCQIDKLAKRLESISLIIFNYDRCVEHFLYHAIQTVTGVKAETAFKLLSNIKIYHPYGVVGQLPWQTSGHGIGFGEEITDRNLLELSQNIKTFSEGTEPGSSEIIEMHETIKKASKIVFLGFSFEAINMKLLSPDIDPKNKNLVECFGTTYGMSESDKDAISLQIDTLFHPRSYNDVMLEDMKCVDLFGHYSKSLSL